MAEDWPGEGQLRYSLNGSLAKPDGSTEAEMTSELTQRCDRHWVQASLGVGGKQCELGQSGRGRWLRLCAGSHPSAQGLCPGGVSGLHHVTASITVPVVTF